MLSFGATIAFDSVWFCIDTIATLAGLLAAFFSFKNWMRTTQLLKSNREAFERQKAPITIKLRTPDPSVVEGYDEVTIPYHPRRDQLSRSELVGILGLYYGKDRFPSQPLIPMLQHGTLNRVLEGASSDDSDETLIIELEQEMFDAFKEAIEKLSH